MTSSTQGNVTGEMPPDRLNEAIGVLTRREVEARILTPVVEAMAAQFGREAVAAVLRDAIVRIAEQQGRQLAQLMGGNGLAEFKASLQFWIRDNALEIEVLEQTESCLSFNVRRCRYAELYSQLGMSAMGGTLSCARDFALIKGFNPDIHLERTQTIMAGAPFCDFRYRLP